MTIPNIALTGLLRSGKDSAAAYLAHRYGYVRFAFGTELKRHYHAIFGESDAKPREGYQWFGQTMRQRDPDVWVRKCFARIDSMRWARERVNEEAGEIAYATRFVITDLRQPNEYERCRAEGYVIIRVTAPESLRIHRAIESADRFNLADLRHETESHVDTFAVDYEINNDGTVDDLYAQIDAIMAKLEAPE